MTDSSPIVLSNSEENTYMAKPNRRTITLITIGLILALGLFTWRMNSMWNSYEGKAQGIHVEGDKASPPTTWWNHLYLAVWGWKTVTVFEVSEDVARQGYRIGYIPFSGKAMIKSQLNRDQRFRLKNGHEGCTFFAVTSDGREIPLKIIARTTKDDATYKDTPLH